MTRNVIAFNFDGTGNEPLDSSSESEARGENISNILKLHFFMGGGLYGGSRYGESARENVKASYYYQGIGTYGNVLSNALEVAFAFSRGDKKEILDSAMYDFVRTYQKGDTVIVTGFSRGAALARHFVSMIENQVTCTTRPFVFLCVFDTVTSSGMPDLSSDIRPSNESLYDMKCSLSPIVCKALHMVSIDEQRRVFRPNLMNYDADRVEEIWFPGVHSNIGGGFFDDGLSDITLSHSLQWLIHLMKCRLLPTFSLDLQSLSISKVLPPIYRNVIDVSDLKIKPNEMGRIHYKQRKGFFNKLTLESRLVCVLKDDHVVTDGLYLPMIHPSVILRMKRDRDYKPQGLEGIKTNIFTGY